MFPSLHFTLLLLLLVCSTTTTRAFQVPATTTSRLGSAALQSPLFAATTTQDDNTVTPSDSSSSSKKAVSKKKNDEFANFDYTNQWYPVIWKMDLPLNKPTRVTVFDVNYVIARIGVDEVIAMIDKCPHKSAALSEGRITEGGNFQCAYHGWSFNGTTGDCLEIPQVVQGNGGNAVMSSSRRACATAVPAMIQQEMVYLFPGGNLEKALLAPLPPRVPELDEKGWRSIPIARDFPVDWAILLENIMDPDHGLFAHGQVGFDLYSASSSVPQTLQEERTQDGGWTVTSSVDAEYKLMDLNKKLIGAKQKKTKKEETTKNSILTFVAPTFSSYCRRDKVSGETSFISAFYITPTGTGRSRFMTAVIYKAPFKLPRWVSIVGLNNFLDQDTYLLATQQEHVLGYEAEAVQKMTDDDPTTFNSCVRRTRFNYRSPSEKMAVRVGAFWDATLSRVPNRVAALQKYDGTTTLPPRSIVLDRAEQHLAICPESQSMVAKCSFAEKWSRNLQWLAVASKAYVTLVARGAWAARVDAWLRPTVLISAFVMSAVVRYLAQRLRKEYYFKYTSDLRDQDLTNIPKVWRDKE